MNTDDYANAMTTVTLALAIVVLAIGVLLSTMLQ
jgi:hypothetical protein